MIADIEILLALFATFFTAVAVVLGVRSVLVGRRDPLRDRLNAIVGSHDSARAQSALVMGGDSGWRRLLQPLAKLGQDTPENMGKLQERLAWAGYRGPASVETYLGTKLLLALILGGSVLLIDQVRPMQIRQLGMLLVVFTSIGFYAPAIWLRNAVAKRQKAVTHTLPDALDLLVSCVEAGLSLEAALERVAQDISASSPVLSLELVQTVKEIEAGLTRSECFRRLAGRTGIGELKSLAAILVQTEMFGTSIGRALRVLAESLRVQRMQRANERAATVAVRLTIPLILCLLPALMTVLMGGAAVRLIKILYPTLEESGGG